MPTIDGAARHDPDFDFEPVPGLPALPPRGEIVLWQGRPATRALAREALGARWIAAYFAAVVLWRFATAAAEGGMMAGIAYGLPYLALGALALGVVTLLAWAQARATVYTITSARVVMRIGAALPVTYNIPFRQIATARLSEGTGGTGTIALELTGENRLPYLVCWPHVRPWHLRHPQPALRAIPGAAHVAAILAEAAETRISQPVIARQATAMAAE